MHTFIFTNSAKKEFEKLPKNIQERVKVKLLFLKKHPDMFSTLKPIQILENATHRLRVGNYRLLLKTQGENNEDSHTFLVLKIRHRREIYKSP